MRNKGVVIALGVIITALCLYYLSFTFVSMRIQQDAVTQATDASGVVMLDKKQSYLDSIWNLPAYNLLGIEYTYKEVKENELSLGLDLQGGMHVILEVSPTEIIRGLSGNSQDPGFIAALLTAREDQKTSQESFPNLFQNAFSELNPDGNLSSLFATSANRGRVSLSDADDKVMQFINEEVESAIDRSYTILKTRIDQFGTSQPNIQRLPGTGRIQIEIPGADNPQRVRKLLQGVARLEFYRVAEPQMYGLALQSINSMLVKEKQSPLASTDITPAEPAADVSQDTTRSELERRLAEAGSDTTRSRLDSLAQTMSPLFALSVPNAMGELAYEVKDTAEINRVFKRPDVEAMIPRNVGIYWDVKANVDQTSGSEYLVLNFLDIGRNATPLLTGETITSAAQDFDEKGRYAVSMKMDPAGTRIWAKVTAQEAAKTPQGRIAIVLDNYVYTSPSVNSEIPNGNSQISGNFTLEEAKDLANVLKAGSLPAPTRIVEEAIIGPTLGKLAQNQGLISMVSGMIIVILFMVAFYARGGWVANFALLFNVFFILGILAQLDAALTLPGIAGIVLTMGMAVDANVLIYERMREEMRAGKRLREVIRLGYKGAFSSIFDSNLTTLITAFALYALGSGPLKGFAITLIVGIATSFFSSVYISRVIIEWLVRKGDDAKVSFETAVTRAATPQRKFDFIGNRKRAYLFSSVYLIVGVVLMSFQGLNLGVDFKGGRSYVVSFPAPVEATAMRSAMTAKFENAGTEVKNYGSNSQVKITTSYRVEDDSDQTDQTVRDLLIQGIEGFTGLQYAEEDAGLDNRHFIIASSTKVGATVADDIKNTSIEAGIISLIGIFLYILFRFRKVQFSAGAILALFHDAAFVFVSYGYIRLFGVSFEMDQVFVAAMLTTIGYSINDTVVIFDRVREYMGLGTGHSRTELINEAFNNTLSRTLITGGTTLLVVAILLIFGGEVLRGFSFSMLIGIIIGTYSSLFVATPIVIDFDPKGRLESKKVPAVA